MRMHTMRTHTAHAHSIRTYVHTAYAHSERTCKGLGFEGHAYVVRHALVAAGLSLASLDERREAQGEDGAKPPRGRARDPLGHG